MRNFGKKYYLEFYKIENNGFVRNYIFESSKFECINNYDWRIKKKIEYNLFTLNDKKIIIIFYNKMYLLNFNLE